MRWTFCLLLLLSLIIPVYTFSGAVPLPAMAEESLVSIELKLPLEEHSVKFAVIGDSGTGGSKQYQVGEQMALYHKLFPFTFVLMLGDNLYGGEDPEDYEEKFELPYKELLDSGVDFYASLGNHDDPDQPYYQKFNMDGKRYYTFKTQNVGFFALDSTQMDKIQLDWLERELDNSDADWKICFFHHPIYSSGARHGSDEDLREVLEPLFLTHGVKAVFSGHDHFYERIKPQKGIYYFVSGAAGKVRSRNIRRSGLTARGFDKDQHFILIEIVGERLYFQAISRSGETVDSGILYRQTTQHSLPSVNP